MPPRGHSSSSHSSRSSSSRSSSSRSFSHSSSSHSSRSYRSSSSSYRSNRSNDRWGDNDSDRYRNDDYYNTPRSGGGSFYGTLLCIAFFVIMALFEVARFKDDLYETSERQAAEQSTRTYQEEKTTAAQSNAVQDTDIFGETLYLKRIDNNSYMLVTESDSYDMTIKWNSEYESYYDRDSDCYLWYNTEVVPNLWQYWYEGISSDYGDYGWMEYEEPDGWFIQEKKSKWVELPGKYDSSKLWHIVDEDNGSSSDDTEEATLEGDAEKPLPDTMD
ncbi:MAG: hypothetical protein J6O17_07395 [Eubacterium sp.]|nr:hypothetical protein [Eubacterium sp.]